MLNILSLFNYPSLSWIILFEILFYLYKIRIWRIKWIFVIVILLNEINILVTLNCRFIFFFSLHSLTFISIYLEKIIRKIYLITSKASHQRQTSKNIIEILFRIFYYFFIFLVLSIAYFQDSIISPIFSL